MSDLISRLSELRCQYNCFDENERDAYHTLSEAIKALSDVPDTNVSDTISRQVANEYFDLYRHSVLSTDEITSMIPTAVAGIVQCKDCKYASPNGVYGCRLERFSEHDKSERLFAYDFCSQGERKDG